MSKKEKLTDKQEENEIEFDGAVEEKLKLLRQFHLNCSHNWIEVNKKESFLSVIQCSSPLNINLLKPNGNYMNHLL